jgi:large subunit ribosomal protein L1
VEYRNDRYGNVHVAIGKVSFEDDALQSNLAAVVDELVRVRPAAAKGRFIRKLTLSSTMGPGVKVDVNALDELREMLR